MPPQLMVRWTDISDKTPLDKFIRILNLRLGRSYPVAGGRGLVVLVADATPDDIAAGEIAYLPFPKFDAKIDGWTMVADAVGSIQIDIWKAPYPTIPTVANSITNGAPPALVAQQINREVEVPGWSTRITAEDTLAFKIDSASGVKRVTLSLSVEKL